MTKTSFAFLIAFAAFFTFGQSQAIKAPVEGKLIYTIPSYYAKVEKRYSDDEFILTFGVGGSSVHTYRVLRLNDNVFAEMKEYNDAFRDRSLQFPIESFVVLEPNGLIQLCIIKSTKPDEIYEVETLALTKEDLKLGKPGAKELKTTFNLPAHAAKVKQYNDDLQKKLDAERAARAAEEVRKKSEAEDQANAKKAAEEKAIAEREAGLAIADFCAPINKYAAMVPNRFKTLKGKVLPADEMYQKGDTTFEAKEVLQYFDFAKIQTRHKSYDNATDLDFYMKLGSKEEVAAKFAVVQGRLKTCFNEKTGWDVNSLSDSMAFVKGKVAIKLRQYNNTWDEDGGNFLHLQVSSK